MPVCVNCNKTHQQKDMAFGGRFPWCHKCYREEATRSAQTDSTGAFTRNRPPKYILDPKDWAKFGY